MKKIAVIGLGAIGAQAFWQLSQEENIEVHGFDLHNPGHPFGASGGDGRLFRHVQYEASGYVPLLAKSDELWRKLESETKQQLRVITTGVIVGSEDSPQIQTSLKGIELYDLPTKFLNNNELKNALPHQFFHPEDVGILDKQAGIIRPELTNLSSIMAAQQRGATLHKNCRVLSIEQSDSDVKISTEEGDFRFDHIIVATGAWIRQLYPQMRKVIQPKKLTSAWFFPRSSGSLQGCPGFVRVAPTHYYGVPSQDGQSIKLGISNVYHEDIETPDSSDYTVRVQNFKPFENLLKSYFPGLIEEPFRTEIYYEGYTEDARPIIQYNNEAANITVAAGFSGHGFKFAPAYGKFASDLAMGKSPDPDFQFLQRNLN